MTRITLAATAALLAVMLTGTPAAGQTVVATSCSELAKRYDEDRRTAHTMIMDLTNQVLQGGSTPNVLSMLGINLGGISPQQAIRKGAVAAIPPNAQTAIMIYLLQANTTMQEMIWKGCRPPGG